MIKHRVRMAGPSGQRPPRPGGSGSREGIAPPCSLADAQSQYLVIDSTVHGGDELDQEALTGT